MVGLGGWEVGDGDGELLLLELEELEEELEVAAAVGQRSVEEELLLRLEEEVGESVAELLAVAVVMMGVGAVFNMTICCCFFP